MCIFIKNKIKLSLVEDYISILTIFNFYNKFKNPSNKEQVFLFKTTQKLKSFYESLFDKLKFDKLSLLILKKELSCSSHTSIVPTDTILKNCKTKLNIIIENLNYKLKKLNIL